MASQETIEGVIFDVDGTLIDSNDAHAHAWVDALVEFGFDVSFEEARPLIGMGGDKVVPTLAGLEEDDERGERISKRRGEIFMEKYFPGVRAFPKTRELFVHLREAGLRIVIASSAKKEELDHFLDRARVRDLVEDKASSSDAESSKPDPDILHAALEKLGLEADQVVMVGDTPYDVEAASRAGIRTIALRSGGWSDEDLAGTIAIYDDPADLLAHVDELVTRSQGSVTTGR
jgi:phosphoglycolate phosphatase-like HAD superfamily hydrolase